MRATRPKSNYVKARSVKQMSSALPKPSPADVWVGGVGDDSDGVEYVSVEIKPAYGNIASIRLNLDELRELQDLIADRLQGPTIGTPAGPGPVEISVPEGTAVEITYT